MHHAGKHLWRGKRVFAIDGSKINLPRSFVAKKYKRPGKRAFYPQGMASFLYNVVARIPVTSTFARHSNERQSAKELLKSLKPKDLVLYDRGYLSAELLALHSRLNIDAVFRAQSNSFKKIREFWKSGARETVIWIECEKRWVQLRLIRFKVKGSEIVLATTLCDKNNFPTRAIAKLYHERWNIEESYKTFKRTLEVEQWHSHSCVGAKQEFFAKLIALFFVRLFELHGRKTNRSKKIRTKPSERVCIKAVQQIFLTAENSRSLQLSNIKKWYQITLRQCTQTKLGRSFARISRRPENKFRQERKKRAKLSKIQLIQAKQQTLP